MQNHAALRILARVLAPILPFITESMYQNLVFQPGFEVPESVHLTRWPTAETAPLQDDSLEAAMATTRRAPRASARKA